jgi:hypothetical protein
MRFFNRFFKREQISALPEDVSSAIEAAWFVDRSTGEDERVFFAIAGRQLVPLDKAEKIIPRWFPELNPAQVKRALDFLDSLARLHIREAVYAEIAAKTGDNRRPNRWRCGGAPPLEKLYPWSKQ